MTDNTVPEGFEMTEIGLIPSDWEVSTLGDVLEEVDVRAGDLSNGGSDLQVLSLTKNEGLILQSDRFKKRIATDDVSKYKVVRYGQIVYNPYVIWEGAVHMLRIYDNGLVSPVYPVLKARPDEAEAYFVDQFLRMPAAISAYNRFASGAVNRRRSIRKNDFLSIQIPLPPLPEQKKIATVLSTIQEAKEKTQAVIEATREMRKSLMKHLFTYGPVPPEDAENVPLKETEIGMVPEEWDVKELVDIATLQRGKDLPKRKQVPGPFPILGAGGIIGYHNEYVCDGPGLVTGRSGSIGTITYTDTKYWPHNTGLYVKDFHGNIPKFAYYLLHMLDFKRYATGVSVPTLNRNFIHTAILPCPSIHIQQQISELLSAVDHKIEAEESKKQALEELFKTLLNNLMTGRIRVNHLDIPGR